jgi:hypothetical protein
MKTKNVSLISFLLLFSVLAFSQSLEKAYLVSNKDLGGDVLLTDLTFEADETSTYATFDLEAPEAGNYYLALWILGGQKDDGSFLLSSGAQHYTWNYQNCRSGVYFVKYTVNGNLNVKKVIIKQNLKS